MSSYALLPLTVVGLLFSNNSTAAFAEPVNAPTVLWQSFNPQIAPKATVAQGTDGSAIVIWKSTESGQAELMSQRFTASGVAVSAPTNLSTSLAINGEIGKVVATISSDHIATVAWEIVRANDAGDIQKVRIGQNGNLLSGPVAVNSQTDGAQINPAIATDSLDHVVIAWSSPIENNRHGAFAQIYSQSGYAQFGEFRVDQSGANAPLQPIVLLSECCGINLAWGKQEDNASSYGIYARSFGLSATPASPETLLASMAAAPSVLTAGADFEQNVRFAWSDQNGVIHSMLRDRYLGIVQAATTLATNYSAAPNSPLWLGVSRNGEFALAWKKSGAVSQPKDVLARFDGQMAAMQEKLLQDFEAPEYLSNSAYAMDIDGDIAAVRVKAHEWFSEQSLTVGRIGGIPNARQELTLAYSPTAASGGMFEVVVNVRNLVLPDYRFNPNTGLQTGVEVNFTADPSVELLGVDSSYSWQCDLYQTKVCRTNALNPGQESPLRFYFRAPEGAQSVRNLFSVRSLETNLSGNINAEALIQVGDATPDLLSIVDQTDVPLSTLVVSAPVIFSGFNVAVPISVSGGEFAINGGPFSANANTVLVTDTVRVRHLSASSFGTSVNTVLTIGGLSDTFSSTTVAQDVTPNAFNFNDLSGVSIGTQQVSNPITINGINAPTNVTVSGGEYQLNGGAFTTVAGLASAGDTIRVRHISGASFLQTVNTTLTLGGVSDVFSSTTLAQDNTPNAFSFVDQINLATGVTVLSAPITVNGINVPVSVTVSGGSYSINGAAFVALAGTVNAGDQIRVRAQTASSANAASNVTLTIGGVSDIFTATTGVTDSTPAAFSFVDITGARVARSVTSSAITVSAINTAVAITVSGNGVKYSKNGGAFTSAAGTVVSGDQIRLQLNASANAFTQLDATATIGGVSDIWSVTTGNR